MSNNAALVLIIAVVTVSSLAKTTFDSYNNTQIAIAKAQSNCAQTQQHIK